MGCELEPPARRALEEWAAQVDKDFYSDPTPAAASAESEVEYDPLGADSPAAARAVSPGSLPKGALASFPAGALFTSVRGLLERHFGVKPESFESLRLHVSGQMVSHNAAPVRIGGNEEFLAAVVRDSAAADASDAFSMTPAEAARLKATAQAANDHGGSLTSDEDISGGDIGGYGELYGLGLSVLESELTAQDRSLGSGVSRDRLVPAPPPPVSQTQVVRNSIGLSGTTKAPFGNGDVRLFIVLRAGPQSANFLRFQGARSLNSRENEATSGHLLLAPPSWYAVLAWSDHPAYALTAPNPIGETSPLGAAGPNGYWVVCCDISREAKGGVAFGEVELLECVQLARQDSESGAPCFLLRAPV